MGLPLWNFLLFEELHDVAIDPSILHDKMKEQSWPSLPIYSGLKSEKCAIVPPVIQLASETKIKLLEKNSKRAPDP